MNINVPSDGINCYMYLERDSNRSAAGWSKLLVQKLWKVSQEMWEHRNRIRHSSNRLHNPTKIHQHSCEVQRLWSNCSPSHRTKLVHPDQVVDDPMVLRLWLKGARKHQSLNSHPVYRNDPSFQSMRSCMAHFLGRSGC